MTFFNRKEEVIDVELTQFGKHLLSKGRLRPHYYTFFDDDVLYDIKFSGMDQEIQNEIGDRIKETPRLKTQYVFKGIETEFARNLEEIRHNGVTEEETRTFRQPSADKDYATSALLGNSKVGSQKSPAWKIHFLDGELSASSPILESEGQPSQVIPQLDAEITYRTSVKADLSEAEFAHPLVTFEDGSYIHTDEESIILEIEEVNSSILNGEIGIEIYKVEDEYLNGRVTGKELLIPLSFQPDIRKVYKITENNIYVPNKSEQPLAPSPNRTNVEYYLDIDVDFQIDPDIMCKVKPEDKTRGAFSSRLQDCKELQTEEVNIYSPDEHYEDPCDD